MNLSMIVFELKEEQPNRIIIDKHKSDMYWHVLIKILS